MSGATGALDGHEHDDILRPLEEADDALADVLPYIVSEGDPFGGAIGRQLAHAQQRVRMAKRNVEVRVRSHTESDPE